MSMMNADETQPYTIELLSENIETKKGYYRALYGLLGQEATYLNIDIDILTDSQLKHTEERVVEKYPTVESFEEFGKEKKLPILRFYRDLMLMEISASIFGYDLFENKLKNKIAFYERLNQLETTMYMMDLFSVDDMQMFIDKSIRPLMFGWNNHWGYENESEEIFDDKVHSIQGYYEKKTNADE
jgi:hypothetical protein